MKRFSSLRSSLIAAFCLSILIPMLVISLYGHLFTGDALTGRLLEDSQAEASLQAAHLLHAIESSSSDANYLGMLASVQAWQAAPEDESLRAAVQEAMLVFVAAHPKIYRLHWLDTEGHPLISINSDVRSVYPMSSDERRRYDDEGYFADVVSQPVGEIAVSFGRSDETDVMLYSQRFANSALVFELFSSHVLQNMNRTGQAWALLDASGRHLLFPQSFGFEGAVPATDEGIVPIIPLFTADSGAFTTDKSLFAYSRFEAYQGEAWLLYLQKPRAEIDGALAQFRLSSAALIAGAIGLAVLFGLWMANDLLRPILALKAEIEALTNGEAIQAKSYRLKELEALSLSFQQMASALAAENQEKRKLISKLINAQENESKRIAYDLHDSLIQQLVGARLYLTMASDKSQNGIKDDLERGSTALSEAIVEARRILQGLHPTILDDLGLADALTEFAYQQAERYSWQIDLKLETLPQSIGKTTSVTIFRIVQEALNNIGKHAEAKAVKIQIRCYDNLRLEIYDDGKGFDLEALNGRGLGINTMRERAELLGGQCRIESQPRQGTRIFVNLPLSDEAISSSNSRENHS